jgi:hypothetical protein
VVSGAVVDIYALTADETATERHEMLHLSAPKPVVTRGR